MQLNLNNNFKNVIGKIDCRAMIWGSDVSDLLPPPDFVLLADCIYYEEVFLYCIFVSFGDEIYVDLKLTA